MVASFRIKVAVGSEADVAQALAERSTGVLIDRPLSINRVFAMHMEIHHIFSVFFAALAVDNDARVKYDYQQK
jgi:hypothetical protein